MMTDREQLAWLAGILDGEGHFSPHAGRPRIQLAQNDREMLDRVQAIVPFAIINGPYLRGPDKEFSHYELTVNGFQRTQAVAAMVWPWLGMVKRRQAAASLHAAHLRWRKSALVWFSLACPSGHLRTWTNLYPMDLGNGQEGRTSRCRKCRGEREWPRPVTRLPCDQCGGRIPPELRSDARYCSRNCRRNAMRHRQRLLGKVPT